MSVAERDIVSLVRDIPDFPKKGILFKDITPVLADAKALRTAVELMADPFRHAGIDYVVCIEARGFIFGSAIATHLGVGFVPVRKKGKLPHTTYDVTYGLEYGTDCLTVHVDSIPAGKKVLIVDDLLATGGTLVAVVDLMNKLNVHVAGVSCLIELSFLNGKSKLSRFPVHTVIKYDS